MNRETWVTRVTSQTYDGPCARAGARYYSDVTHVTHATSNAGRPG